MDGGYVTCTIPMCDQLTNSKSNGLLEIYYHPPHCVQRLATKRTWLHTELVRVCVCVCVCVCTCVCV